MSLPPPRSPLFPYTTLFRSERIRIFLNPLDFLLWLSEELDTSGWEQLEKEWAISIGVGLNVVFLIARANANLGARRDRKITRLNSSHTVISYAVFCLKKKRT